MPNPYPVPVPEKYAGGESAIEEDYQEQARPPRVRAPRAETIEVEEGIRVVSPTRVEIPIKELELAPSAIPGAKLDFTQRMREQGLLPDNWPEGVSVFQDVNLALSNLPPQKSELLNQELTRFIPAEMRDRLYTEAKKAAGIDTGVVPLTDEEWHLANSRPSQGVGGITKGFLAKTAGGLSRFTDGPIVGDIMDALEWPADRTEQLLGTILYPSWSGHWWWDVPDGYGLWETSTLYYDVIGGSLAHGKFDGSAYKEVESAMQRGEPWFSDDPESLGIYQRYQQGWTDAMMKGILDPLWLVGGGGWLAKGFRTVPIGTRLYTGSKFFRAGVDILEFGVVGGGKAVFNPYKVVPLAKLAKMPFLGRFVRIGMAAGLNAYESDLLKATAYSVEVANRAVRVRRLGQPVGWWARLFKLSPESQYTQLVNETYAVISHVAADPLVTPEDMRVFLEAVRTGDATKLPAHLPSRFTQNEWAATLAEVMEAQTIRPQNFSSLQRTILTPDEFDAGLVAALAKSPKAGKRFANQFSRGHEMWRMQVLTDLQSHIYKAIAATVDYNAAGVMERLQGAQKRLLSITLLNTPGFAALNTVNNEGLLFYILGPAELGRAGFKKSTMIKKLADFGLAEDIVNTRAGDGTLAQYLGLAGKAKPGEPVHFSKLNWLIAPFGSAAHYADGLARMQAFFVGVRRAFRHNWQGIATPMPDLLRTTAPPEWVKAAEALIDSAAEPGFAQRLARFREGIASGKGLKTTASLRDEWIRRLLKASGIEETPDVMRVMQEQFDELGMTGHLDDALESATDLDDLQRRLDVVRMDLEAMADHARHLQQLEPVAKNMSEADFLAIRQRQRELKTELTSLPEGHPDIPRLQQEVAQATQEWQQANHVFNGTTGTNMHRIDIAEDALGRARVEMTERWLNRIGFESGTLGKGKRKYLKATQKMFSDLDARRKAILAAYARGEKGITKMWRAYYAERLTAVEANLKQLEKLLVKGNPDALPVYRLIADSRLAELRGKDSAMAEAFKRGEDVVGGITRRRIDRWIREEIYLEADLMGLSPTRREGNLGMYDSQPVLAEAITGDTQWATDFLNGAEEDILKLWMQPLEVGELPPAVRRSALAWADSLHGDYTDFQLTAMNVGKASADHIMHDYGLQTNLDKMVQWIMPYHFWPTRSMWRWAQRVLTNPGAVASIALSYDQMEAMTKDLPTRFRGKFKVPIPWLGDKMASSYGPATEMFFNPLPMIFPTMMWQQDFSMESRRNTIAGRLLDFWSQNGPAPNPFLVMGGSAVGLLDKEEWLSRSWPRSLPFGLPGTTAQMALIAFANGADVELPDYLTDEDMGQLMGGSGLPLIKLQRVLGVPEDQWDTYRIDRMLAGLYTQKAAKVGPIESKRLLRDYLEAIDTKSGPFWEEARQLASSEAGIRFLTSWAFGSSISIYPEGEQMMRALDPVYREYAARGDLDTFYDRYPEYQVRRIALAGLESPEARLQETEKALFWYDLSEALDARERELEPVRTALDAIHEKEEFYNTKAGRFYRSLFEKEQSQYISKWQSEINQIYARYANVDKTPSVKNDPYTRALMSLRNDYYELRLEDFLPQGITLELATEEQINKADELLESARDDFVMSLPENRVSAQTKFMWAVEHNALGLNTSLLVAKAEREDRGADIVDLIEARTDSQNIMMERAKSTVSRYDFEQFINRSKEPPSAVQSLYNQAYQEWAEYNAINDLDLEPVGVKVSKTGKVSQLTESERKRQLREDYWNKHPLLQRFYGNEPIDFTSSESAAAYGRLDDIRQEYYNRSGLAQLDYIYSVREELNEILDTLGLPLVDLRKLGVADPVRWDLSIPGIGIPAMERLEYSINKRYSDEALNPTPVESQ